MKIIIGLLDNLLATFALFSLFTHSALAQGGTPIYDPDSYDPITGECASPIKFRVATNTWNGKVSKENYIQVSGGGWNKVHCEATSRTLEDGDTFTVRGNKYQVGVGLCIESCDFKCGVRFTHNCVGFYGDNSNFMFAADKTGKEYKIPADNRISIEQGFTYNKDGNCVEHVSSSGKKCVPLPDHFKNQPLRAIGQVWNSAKATVV